MKDRVLGVLFMAGVFALLGMGVREYLIHNGRLTSDLNADGHSITNLPDGFFPTNGFLRTHQDISGKADKTNTYTKAETDAKIVELAPPPGNYAVVSNAAMTISYVEFDDLWYGWYFSGMAQRARSAVSLYDESSRHYLSHSNNILEPNLWGDFANGVFRPFAYALELADAARDGTNYTNSAKGEIAPTVSNIVTKAYVESLGIESGLQSESDPVWEREKPGYATTNDVNDVARAFETNVVRAVITNRVYNLTPDYELGVVWRKAASNGAFYERCYTNDTSTVEAVP